MDDFIRGYAHTNVTPIDFPAPFAHTRTEDLHGDHHEPN